MFRFHLTNWEVEKETYVWQVWSEREVARRQRRGHPEKRASSLIFALGAKGRGSPL